MLHDANGQRMFDVVIVGAGPVGMLLAADLALMGVAVQVLERAVEASTTIKAGSINLASAEILARRGLLAPARMAHARGVGQIAKVMASAFGLGPEQPMELAGRRVIRAGHYAGILLDNSKLEHEDPDVASHLEALDATLVVQGEVERLLEEHASRLGVPVQRGVEVGEIEQTESGVGVHTAAGESYRARFVVGCDGGRSTVRKMLDFAFPGTDPEITGRQAVAEFEDASVLNFGWNWTPRGVYRYGPMPGVVLTVEFDGPPGERGTEVTAQEIERSLRHTSGTDVRVKKLLGKATRWTDNARQASTYRKGGVLLAGDAAHVHSPFNGQGLNTGLGDATNLGWKLAAVLKGWAPHGLLDSYEAERHPVGAWVLEWTRGQIAAMRPDPKVGELRKTLMDLMNTRDGMTQTINKISGIARQLPLTGHHRLIGRVIPDIMLADGRSVRELFVKGQFVLLGGSQSDCAVELAMAYGDRIAVVRSDFETVVSGLEALLARPDGVVVWVAEQDHEPELEALSNALTTWAGDPSSETVGRCGGRVSHVGRGADRSLSRPTPALL